MPRLKLRVGAAYPLTFGVLIIVMFVPDTLVEKSLTGAVSYANGLITVSATVAVLAVINLFAAVLFSK